MRILNKKALHNYHILESLEAGIVLTGPEVKSIKGGHIELSGAYVKILGSEAFLINALIPEYQPGSSKHSLRSNDLKEYDPQRSRKLLLHRNQIDSLIGKNAQKGTTLLPVSIYEKNNRLKLEVGIGKSKKEFDKREVIKKRDQIRRIEQELRGKE